jgi:HAD superfamily hydrolase (TIGR01662 family)
VTFDVDGTLTTTKSGETFRKSADDWQWLPGRVEKCRELRDQGVRLAIASNQAGVAFPWSKFSEAEIRLELELIARMIGAEYLGICCTTPNSKALPAYHNPNDRRRKPNPGMLLEAMQTCGSVGPSETLFVGDRPEDEQAAQAAGVSFVWADTFFTENETAERGS